jgi:hypothetical protein
MSISNLDKTNYEDLYKSLKEEFNQSKEENDELCKEYESTIQLLTESLENYEKEKKEFQNKISIFENDVKNMKQEKENLIRKNKDKIIDIQCLNEQNEKLNKLLEKYKEEKSIFTNKLVSLENDIVHYQNKIRECEDFIEELKYQLENALEENITMQSEFGNYKLNSIEQLSRKEEEIKQLRDDINSKEIKIKKLSQNPKDIFDIQKVQQRLIKDKKSAPAKRRYSLFENNNYNKLINFQNKQNVFNSPKLIGKSLFINNSNQNNYESSTTPRNYKNNNNYFNCIINSEKKIREAKEKMNGLNTIISTEEINIKNDYKKFEDLVICDEFNINFISKNNLKVIYSNNNDNNDRKIEFEKELKNLIIRIHKRKNELIKLKKYLNEKLSKLEFKIKS